MLSTAIIAKRLKRQQDELARRFAHQNGSSTVWAYLRGTVAGSQGFSAQRSAVVTYCEEKGLTLPPSHLVEEISDASKPLLPGPLSPETETGAGAPQRPLLMMLLGHLTTLPRSTLVVAQLSRLSIIPIEQEILFQLLRRRQVTVLSAAASEQDLFAGTKGFSANLRALELYETSVRGFRRHNEAADRPAAEDPAPRMLSGHLPFGYETVDGEMEIKQDQAEIIRWVFYWRDQHFYSYGAIAREVKKKFSQPDWYAVKVMRIIRQRELYEGIISGRPRPELRILPASWPSWAKQNNAAKEQAQ